MIIFGVNNRNIIFHGNSLFNLEGGTTVSNGRYCEIKTYNNIIASRQNLSAVFLSVNGDPTTTKISNWSTQTLPVISPNDIVILWEITNDVNVNGLTGAQAYANLVTFAGLVRGVGAKIVCCTAIPRNHTSDTTQNARNFDCNSLLIADTSNFDLVINLNTDSRFDQQSDANDATYYQADKLHLTTSGSDIIASMISSSLINSGLI